MQPQTTVEQRARTSRIDSAAVSDATPSLALVFAIALSIIPVAIRAAYYPDYPGTDDSFIHAAIIENLRAGRGWGINPGEPVNLSTSPLFTLLMLAVSHLWPDVIDAGTAITAAAVSLAVFGTFVVASRITASRAVGLCAAALAATNLHLWRWTGTFIEAPLAYAGVIAVLVAFEPLYRLESRRPELTAFMMLGLAIGVLSLLRYECGLLGLGFFVHHLVNDRRYLIRRYASAACGLALPLLLWAAFALAMFGTVLPTTFSAKTTSGLILFNPTLLRQYVGVLGSGFLAGILMFAGACVVLLANGAYTALGRAIRRSLLFVTFAAAVLAFYYLKTESLQSPARYLLPAMGVLPLALAPFLAAARPVLKTGWRFVAVSLVAAQFVVAFAVNQLRVAPVLAQMNREYVAAMSGVAAQLDRLCHHGDVVLVEFDLGVVSYRHNRTCRIADGGALASPELRGLSVPQKIATTHARFVVESLGAPGHSDISADGQPLTLLWSRSFASHSVAEPDRTYVVRLFEVGQP